MRQSSKGEDAREGEEERVAKTVTHQPAQDAEKKTRRRIACERKETVMDLGACELGRYLPWMPCHAMPCHANLEFGADWHGTARHCTGGRSVELT